MGSRQDLIGQDPAMQCALDSINSGFLRNDRVQSFVFHLMSLVESVLGKAFDRCVSTESTNVKNGVALFRKGLAQMRTWDESHWAKEVQLLEKSYVTIKADFTATVNLFVTSIYINTMNRKKLSIDIRYPSIPEFLMVLFNRIIDKRDVQSGYFFSSGSDKDRMLTLTTVLRETLYEFMFAKGYVVRCEVKEGGSDEANSGSHSAAPTNDAADDQILKRTTEENLARCKPTEEDFGEKEEPFPRISAAAVAVDAAAAAADGDVDTSVIGTEHSDGAYGKETLRDGETGSDGTRMEKGWSWSPTGSDCSLINPCTPSIVAAPRSVVSNASSDNSSNVMRGSQPKSVNRQSNVSAPIELPHPPLPAPSVPMGTLREKMLALMRLDNQKKQSLETSAQTVIDDIQPEDSISSVGSASQASGRSSFSHRSGSGTITQDLLESLGRTESRVENWLTSS